MVAGGGRDLVGPGLPSLVVPGRVVLGCGGPDLDGSTEVGKRHYVNTFFVDRFVSSPEGHLNSGSSCPPRDFLVGRGTTKTPGSSGPTPNRR